MGRVEPQPAVGRHLRLIYNRLWGEGWGRRRAVDGGANKRRGCRSRKRSKTTNVHTSEGLGERQGAKDQPLENTGQRATGLKDAALEDSILRSGRVTRPGMDVGREQAAWKSLGSGEVPAL